MLKDSSIDKTELAKFRVLADKWWDKDGEFKSLHQINPVRLQYVTDKIIQHFNLNKNTQKPLEGLKILDIGCGGGLMSVPLHELGAEVTGIDAVEDNIKTAKYHADRHKLPIKFLHTTVEEEVDKNTRYDTVISLEVIEHVANPEIFVSNLARLVKPGGVLIISTLNRTLKSWFLGIIMAEYVLGWVPKNTHDYNKFLQPAELNRFLTKANMNLKELRGLVFDLPTQAWHLSSNININYLAYATRGC